MFAANKDAALTGVSGEFKYRGKTKTVHVAFEEPLFKELGGQVSVKDIDYDKPDRIERWQKKGKKLPMGVQADKYVKTKWSFLKGVPLYEIDISGFLLI